MKVLIEPAFEDNYIFFPLAEDGKSCFVVDPGDSNVALNTIKKQELSLKGILLTHHHYDHIGGVEKLLETHPGIPVYGPENEDRIPMITHPVGEGTQADALGAEFYTVKVKGHTLSHVIYIFPNVTPNPVVFVGDTLFRGGCGRLFEGTPEDMYQSLEKIKKLSPDSLIYCTHEYTESNYHFLNEATGGLVKPVKEKLESIKSMRKKDLFTVPFSLQDDMESNLFLNTSHTEVQKILGTDSALETFTKLRILKDSY